MMVRITKIVGVIAVAATLAACGETAVERAATGAVAGYASGGILGVDRKDAALAGAVGGMASCYVNANLPNCR